MARLIHSVNDSTFVGGLADSGYFLDYDSDVAADPLSVTDKPSTGYKKVDNSHQITEEQNAQTGKNEYAKLMKQLFKFMNTSAGTSDACLQASIDPSRCIFANYLLPHIRSKLLILHVNFVINISFSTCSD